MTEKFADGDCTSESATSNPNANSTIPTSTARWCRPNAWIVWSAQSTPSIVFRPIHKGGIRSPVVYHRDREKQIAKLPPRMNRKLDDGQFKAIRGCVEQGRRLRLPG